jgi:hypothetical protein
LLRICVLNRNDLFSNWLKMGGIELMNQRLAALF